MFDLYINNQDLLDSSMTVHKFIKELKRSQSFKIRRNNEFRAKKVKSLKQQKVKKAGFFKFNYEFPIREDNLININKIDFSEHL